MSRAFGLMGTVHLHVLDAKQIELDVSARAYKEKERAA